MIIPEEKNILLFGATGKTGVQILNELVSRKIKLSVFVREESINKLVDKNLQIIQGDVLNYSQVESSFEGESYSDVIISLGSRALKGSDLRFTGTKNIIKALHETRVKSKIHVISALGVGESWDQLGGIGKLISNILLKSVLADHGKQEKIVMDSPNSYHILRPVGLKDGESTGSIHLQSAGKLPSSSIRRSDVAKYLVDSMLENKEGISAICSTK